MFENLQSRAETKRIFSEHKIETHAVKTRITINVSFSLQFSTDGSDALTDFSSSRVVRLDAARSLLKNGDCRKVNVAKCIDSGAPEHESTIPHC